MPAPNWAELLATVQLLTVKVPPLSIPPPGFSDSPSEMVRPESVAITLFWTRNTWTALLPLIVTTLAPGPSMASRPAVSFSFRVLESVTDCGAFALKTLGSNSIWLPARLVLALAWVMQ